MKQLTLTPYFLPLFSLIFFKATIITSQLPVKQWHAYLNDPTLADAILDRVVHASHRLELTGESMRKRRAT